jgi:hypothetical protein
MIYRLIAKVIVEESYSLLTALRCGGRSGEADHPQSILIMLSVDSREQAQHKLLVQVALVEAAVNLTAVLGALLSPAFNNSR